VIRAGSDSSSGVATVGRPGIEPGDCGAGVHQQLVADRDGLHERDLDGLTPPVLVLAQPELALGVDGEHLDGHRDVATRHTAIIGVAIQIAIRMSLR
jgi:hypothetical protein